MMGDEEGKHTQGKKGRENMINKHQNRGLRGGQEHGRALVVPDLLLFPFRLLGSLHVAALNRGFYKCCNG